MVGLLGYDRCGFGRRIGPGVACGPRARSHLYASGGVASRSATGAAVGVNGRRVQLEATRIGELTLIWHREPGLGGNGRGCQVAEVLLMKK